MTTSTMLTIEPASPMIEIGSMVPGRGEGDEFHVRSDSFLEWFSGLWMKIFSLAAKRAA